MRILFDHHEPFFLTHGGFQIQIDQTKEALERIGVEIERVRWWDANQTGHIIHFFGAAPVDYIELARRKSLKVVQTTLFTATCNRSDLRLKMQGAIIRAFLATPAAVGIKRQLNWKSFLLCDMNIVGLEAERRVLEWVYGVPPARITVLPLGLSQEFLAAGPAASRGDGLICVGTITERKNIVPLARMAREAQVPILFVGKPYDESDPYWAEFAALIDDRWVRYHPHVEDLAELINLYHSVRGSVVMSRYENWCLAAHEAAACGLPLLLPSQKWAHERFGNQAYYFAGQQAQDTAILREFYHKCPSLMAPKVELNDWTEVAEQLRSIYQSCLHAP